MAIVGEPTVSQRAVLSSIARQTQADLYRRDSSGRIWWRGSGTAATPNISTSEAKMRRATKLYEDRIRQLEAQGYSPEWAKRYASIAAHEISEGFRIAPEPSKAAVELDKPVDLPGFEGDKPTTFTSTYSPIPRERGDVWTPQEVQREGISLQLEAKQHSQEWARFEKQYLTSKTVDGETVYYWKPGLTQQQMSSAMTEQSRLEAKGRDIEGQYASYQTGVKTVTARASPIQDTGIFTPYIERGVSEWKLRGAVAVERARQHSSYKDQPEYVQQMMDIGAHYTTKVVPEAIGDVMKAYEVIPRGAVEIGRFYAPKAITGIMDIKPVPGLPLGLGYAEASKRYIERAMKPVTSTAVVMAPIMVEGLKVSMIDTPVETALSGKPLVAAALIPEVAVRAGIAYAGLSVIPVGAKEAIKIAGPKITQIRTETSAKALARQAKRYDLGVDYIKYKRATPSELSVKGMRDIEKVYRPEGMDPSLYRQEQFRKYGIKGVEYVKKPIWYESRLKEIDAMKSINKAKLDIAAAEKYRIPGEVTFGEKIKLTELMAKDRVVPARYLGEYVLAKPTEYFRVLKPEVLKPYPSMGKLRDMYGALSPEQQRVSVQHLRGVLQARQIKLTTPQIKFVAVTPKGEAMVISKEWWTKWKLGQLKSEKGGTLGTPQLLETQKKSVQMFKDVTSSLKQVGYVRQVSPYIYQSASIPKTVSRTISVSKTIPVSLTRAGLATLTAVRPIQIQKVIPVTRQIQIQKPIQIQREIQKEIEITDQIPVERYIEIDDVMTVSDTMQKSLTQTITETVQVSPQIVVTPQIKISPNIIQPIRITPTSRKIKVSDEIVEEQIKLIPPLGFKEKKKRQREKKKKGYDVYVKMRGELKPFGKSITLGRAIATGERVTAETPARTFKVLPAGAPKATRGIALRPTPRYRVKGGSMIEKTKYAINTAGEISGITMKGVEAQRRKRVKII